MSSDDSNPAASPTPCQDIQGDGRWMCMVCFTVTVSSHSHITNNVMSGCNCLHTARRNIAFILILTAQPLCDRQQREGA